MQSYKHILLATDFSQRSEKAARKAVGLAGYFNAKITLLHVVEHFPEESTMQMPPPENKSSRQLIGEETHEQLEQFSKRIEHHGAILLVRMSIDAAKEVIIEVANEIKADLVVIAAHDKKEMIVLPSSTTTTQTVVDKARCDVLVVKADAEVT